MIADLSSLPIGDDDAELIDAISMWQPWASWVAWGWKPIETRTHARFKKLAGKNVAIHAASVWDKHAITHATPYLTPEQIEQTYELLRGKWPASAIVCIATIAEHRLLEPSDAPRALIECETLRFGLIISGVAVCVPPYPIKGRQGIWKVRVPR